MPTKNVPARMTIMNIVTGAALDFDALHGAQFNPTELDEDLTVNWNKLAVLGLSHMPLQYQQTDNHALSVDLAFRAFDDTGKNRLADVQRARRFLLSLCYSSQGSPATVIGGAPPRVLFVWPTLIELVCVVKKLHFHHTLFNTQGAPVHFSCKVDLEEIRDVRLYSEQVRDMGTQRSGQVVPGQPTGGANNGSTQYGGEF